MARESLGVIGRCRPAYRRTTDALNNLGWLPNLVLRFTVGFMFFSGAVDKLRDLGKFTAMFASLGIPAAQEMDGGGGAPRHLAGQSTADAQLAG
jgi:putative oxidoreductase